jgi:hypothetical protein
MPLRFRGCLSPQQFCRYFIVDCVKEVKFFFMTVNDANEWLSVEANFPSRSLVVYGAGSISPALEHQLNSEIVVYLQRYYPGFKVSYIANQQPLDNNCGVLCFCWILQRAFYSWNADIFDPEEAALYRRRLRLDMTVSNDLFVYLLYKQLCYVYGEGYWDGDALPVSKPPTCSCGLRRPHSSACSLGTDLITLPELSFLDLFEQPLSGKKRTFAFV